MKLRAPTVYATTKKRFCKAELVRLGFREQGSSMEKRGAGRSLLATAFSPDGMSFRVQPLVRHWR